MGALGVYAIPKEIKPEALEPIQAPLRHFFNNVLQLRPSHPVYSGAPGDWHRYLWAARFVGVTADGSPEVIVEWPEGMSWAMPMIGEDTIENVWYRIIGENPMLRVQRAAGRESEAEHLAALRRESGLQRLLGYYCRSARHGKGRYVGVRLEAFYAGKSYKTGRIKMSRATVGARSCVPGKPAPELVTPGDPPPWYREK
jgi:hypothetical protein